MRRFFRSLSDFSLFQQLVFIIVSFVVLMLAFFGIYLKGNINDLVTSQTLSLVQRSQDNLIIRIESGGTINPSYDYDREVMHFIYNNGKFQTYVGLGIYESSFLDSVTETVQLQEESLNEGTMTSSGTVYYYRYYRMDNNREVISFISEAYAKGIESTLLSSISNTSALAVSIIFIMLMIWCLSIIAPLQQIRNYINKVRKGENASLNLERHDEIGELSRELVSLQDELKHQEETKEEMIHNISHDLKTPIATIKSYAESIKDGIYPYDTLEKSVDVIIENADRLEGKVHSLLFLNRLDYMMDQARETEKTTDMKQTVEKVLLSLKMIRPEVTISCQLEETVFRGDEESWRIVIENLIDNALRYAVSTINITISNGQVSVFNDGPSISEDRMKKLFKPFEKGTNGKFGLGLSICHKVCQAYEYDIYAENLENGVIFTITDNKKPVKAEKRKRRKTGENIENEL